MSFKRSIGTMASVLVAIATLRVAVHKPQKNVVTFGKSLIALLATMNALAAMAAAHYVAKWSK